MSRTVVRCICAIGQSGQLGLDGHLPWEGHQGPEYQADVARFFQMTQGHVLLAGPRTINSVPGFAFNDRTMMAGTNNPANKNAPLAQGTAARFEFHKEAIDFFGCASRLPFGEPAAMRGSEVHMTSRQTWQRPTLPRLKTKYHRRRGVSRPSSEWDRVQPPRHNHQVGGDVI